MQKLKNNWPTIIPIIFLLFSFSSWPYAFYQLLRWVVCIFPGYLAYKSYQLKETSWVIIFTIIAIIFNPITPFYMTKSMWRFLDLVVLILLVVSLFRRKKN